MEKYIIRDKSFKKGNQASKETIYALANGFLGIKGSIELNREATPGTYISGCFDRSGLSITELVNLPNPLLFKLFIMNKNGLEELILTEENCVKFEENINFKNRTFNYSLKLKSKSGFIFSINSQRFVSWVNRHQWASTVEITSEDFDGYMFIENIIDSNIFNNEPVPFEKMNHFKAYEPLNLKNSIGLVSTLRDTGREIITLKSFINRTFDCERIRYRVDVKNPVELFKFAFKSGKPYRFDLCGVVYYKRTAEDILFEAKENLAQFVKTGYDTELDRHSETVKENWGITGIDIEGDLEVQKALNWSISQLNSSAFMIDSLSSIGAKGLHGEGYKGHVFWDTEIFMLPFFIYTNPEIARRLLMYRYNTLNGARENAILSGFKGARFPWESAERGLEVTPNWGVDYDGKKVRIWTGDIEYHISSDIVLSIYHYYRATLDKEFIINYGAEIVLETGFFWESRLEYNAEFDRYEINDVIGPDEFHEHVNNNVYTNYLAKWNLKYAAETYNWLKENDETKFMEITSMLDINEATVKKWKKLADKVYIPRDKNSRVIEQFEGYFDLEEYPIVEHDKNGMPVWPEGFDIGKLNDATLIKQPDLLMLMYLMPEHFEFEEIKENYDFYEKRTMHKSSLSPCVHALLSISVHEYDHAYEYFKKTLFTDLSDNQGNSALGIHAASTGGAWLSAVMGFGRFFIDSDDCVNFDPWLPEHWGSLSYSIIWRGTKLSVTISQNKFSLTAEEDIIFKFRGKEHKAEKGIEKECDLN
jgi:kojibiose phosphorylase